MECFSCKSSSKINALVGEWRMWWSQAKAAYTERDFLITRGEGADRAQRLAERELRAWNEAERVANTLAHYTPLSLNETENMLRMVSAILDTAIQERSNGDLPLAYQIIQKLCLGLQLQGDEHGLLARG